MNEYEANYTRSGDCVVTDRDEPRARYIVWQDKMPDDPREWSDNAQTLVYRAAYLSRNVDRISDADTSTMEAYFRVYEATHNEDHALKIAQRYARVFEPEARITLHSVRGYSQGQWCDTVTVTVNGTDPEPYAETFAQYFVGDVYCVKRETYTACTVDGCHGDEDAHWDTDTVIGGIYASDATEAVAQFVAHWE